MRCPGQDMQYWKPGAIFEEKCPQCGQTVEFFKDNTARMVEAKLRDLVAEDIVVEEVSA